MRKQKERIAYEVGRNCYICNKDRWLDSSDLSMRTFLLTSTVSSCKHIITVEGKLIGVAHEDKDICIPCLFFLIGLEDYYGKFYYEFLDNEEAKYIVSKIFSDKQLNNKIAKIRSKGEFIPNKIIKNIISHRQI